MESTTTAENLATEFINELEYEAASSRRCIERIPADKFTWKPHEKSMTFVRLATHIAEMFSWVKTTITTAELDFATIDYKPFEPESGAELLEFFDRCINESVESLKHATNEVLSEKWTMKNGDQTYFSKPRKHVLQRDILNHISHHRGQLSVYLRLNDIAVPEIYGPSADEGQM